jgi:hypothetical protein
MLQLPAPLRLWLIIGWLSFSLTGFTPDTLMTAFKAVNLHSAKVWLEKVQFKAADNVNDTSPITVHIIVPYKPELLKELMKMDAKTYFRKLPQIKTDYVGQFDIFEWDINTWTKVRGANCSILYVRRRGLGLCALQQPW